MLPVEGSTAWGRNFAIENYNVIGYIYMAARRRAVNFALPVEGNTAWGSNLAIGNYKVIAYIAPWRKQVTLPIEVYSFLP